MLPDGLRDVIVCVGGGGGGGGGEGRERNVFKLIELGDNSFHH